MPRLARFRLGAAVLSLLPLSSLSAATPTPAPAGNISVHRDRDGWTATIRGSFGPSEPEILLTAGGDITVRGGRTKVATYSVTERYAAASESQARQAALTLSAAIGRQAGSSSLAFPRTSFLVGQAVRLEIPRATRQLTVVSVAGNIDVAGIDGSVVTRNGAGRTLLDQIQGDAEIQTAGGATVLGLIGGDVRCISGGGSICARTIRGQSFFETRGGEIYLAEALGAVRAQTGAGSIRIGHAGSSVAATTQGGPIEVGRAAGVVTANNSGGPIRVSSAPGVRCTTASGAIRLTGVSGTVIASTTLGNIIASLFDARLLANSFLQTGGGDITVLIPSNISVTLKATCTGGIGAIVSDYPIRLSTRGVVLEAEGRINGGGPVLQIAGKNGTIFIKRQ
jgi:DUF4097 and DUF4098 domain-containing protein YvlB